MTKKYNENFKNSTKCWISDNIYFDPDVKVRVPCHITRKYRGSAHRDFDINVKLNHKIPIVFRNLKNYDSQELGKFNLKIYAIPNGLEKYMSFSINNELVFIDSFQCLSSLSDSLVKILDKNDIRCLSQEFDSNPLDLVKQKGFYCYEYTRDIRKFGEKLPSKEKFYSSLTGKKTLKKSIIMLLVSGRNLR